MKIELDIEADIYPELHKSLSCLTKPGSRPERLRQLAASGLVWEQIRIRSNSSADRLTGNPLPSQSIGEDDLHIRLTDTMSSIPVLTDAIGARGLNARTAGQSLHESGLDSEITATSIGAVDIQQPSMETRPADNRKTRMMRMKALGLFGSS